MKVFRISGRDHGLSEFADRVFPASMKVFRISGRDVGNPVGAVATLVGASMKVFRISGRDVFSSSLNTLTYLRLNESLPHKRKRRHTPIVVMATGMGLNESLPHKRKRPASIQRVWLPQWWASMQVFRISGRDLGLSVLAARFGGLNESLPHKRKRQADKPVLRTTCELPQ